MSDGGISYPPDWVITKPPTCVFCGTHKGPFHVEDVFPEWVRDVLPVPLEVSRSMTGSDYQWRRNVLHAKLKHAVCRSCNNGWMSDLETAVIPYLRDMMAPKAVPVNLNAHKQTIIAFWANLKAICLELSLRQSIWGYTGGFVVPGQFKYLYEHGDAKDYTPPPSTQVWLFAFQAQAAGSNVQRIATHHSVSYIHRLAGESEDGAGPEGLLSTFTLGCLGFQISTSDLTFQGDADSLTVPLWLRLVLLPVWPVVDSVATWLGSGPAGVVTSQTLGAATTWAGVFTEGE